MNTDVSSALFARAKQVIPGGVSSPVRSFRAVGRDPLFMTRGQGAMIYSEDDLGFIDYVGSYGPLILGHAAPTVVAALQQAAQQGTSYGAPTRAEIELSELLCARVPGLQMVRLVNSGTEATMSALRLARAATGRQVLIKFAGCYHGHGDAFLVQAGSGALTHGVPSSPGVPPAVIADTVVLPFNDLAAVERTVQQLDNRLAAIIVEPVPGNMGVVLPQEDFLPGLRRLTQQAGALLIFDEVMSGFRVHPGGASALYGLQADLITLGKVIGGGLPVGAYGGRRDLMEQLSPLGPVYQAGTLSGNPLATAAGMATLRALDDQAYRDLFMRTEHLCDGLQQAARHHGVPVWINRLGAMFTVFFSETPVRDLASAQRSDTEQFAAFFRALLRHGVYWPPSQYEACFVSLAHGEREIEATIAAAEQAFAEVWDRSA